MIIDLAAAARVVPLTALMLAVCASQSASEKRGQELQAARAQAVSKPAETSDKP
jgi:hypothetical protein